MSFYSKCLINYRLDLLELNWRLDFSAKLDYFVQGPGFPLTGDQRREITAIIADRPACLDDYWQSVWEYGTALATSAELLSTM